MAAKEEYQDLCRPPLQSSEECPCSAPEETQPLDSSL
jgi:hypothetical protein